MEHLFITKKLSLNKKVLSYTVLSDNGTESYFPLEVLALNKNKCNMKIGGGQVMASTGYTFVLSGFFWKLIENPQQ